jgi:hypothetical protein
MRPLGRAAQRGGVEAVVVQPGVPINHQNTSCEHVQEWIVLPSDCSSINAAKP